MLMFTKITMMFTVELHPGDYCTPHSISPIIISLGAKAYTALDIDFQADSCHLRVMSHKLSEIASALPPEHSSKL